MISRPNTYIQTWDPLNTTQEC